MNQNNLPEVVNEFTAQNNLYKSARIDILLIVAFTAVNIFLTLTMANLYFLFSAFIPFNFVLQTMFACGKFPPEYYASDMEFWPEYFFYAAIAVAVISIAFYLICYIFSSKNRYGWMIAALAFFAVDTVYLLMCFNLDLIVDLIFHGIVIFFLVRGILAGLRLKELPSEEELLAAINESNNQTENTDPIPAPVEDVPEE